MSWLWIALGAYFLNAVAVTGDAVLLRRAIPDPVRYTIYVGFLGVCALVLAPWGFAVPTLSQIALSVGTGWVMLASLVAIFGLLKRFEPSRVMPVFGASVVLVLLVGEEALLHRGFAAAELIAVAVLLVGTFLLTRPRRGLARLGAFVALVAVAAFLQAVYFLSAKMVFSQLGFVNGFIWTRLGAAVGAAILLWGWRRVSGASAPRPRARVGVFVLFNRLVAGTGSVLLNDAVALGSPTLVQAVRGSEYAFIFLLALALSVAAPRLLREELGGARVAEKILGLVAVGSALAILALQRS